LHAIAHHLVAVKKTPVLLALPVARRIIALRLATLYCTKFVASVLPEWGRSTWQSET
jgi:hypothetical protein